MLMTEVIPIRPVPLYKDVGAVKVLVINRLCVVFFYDQTGDETDKCRFFIEEDEYAIWGVRAEFLVELALDKMGLERK